MKIIPLFLASILSFCFATVPARADEILLGTPHDFSVSNGASFAGFVNGDQYLAQSFMLSHGITVTGINLGIASDSVDSTEVFLFQITNRIGLGTSFENVVSSFAYLAGNNGIPATPCCSGGPGLPPYLSLDVPSVSLGPGQYYLVASEIYHPGHYGGAGWFGQTTALTSAVGTIGPQYSTDFISLNTSNPADSPWSQHDFYPRSFDFQILGTVHSVPEPFSLLLVLNGIVMLSLARLLKKHF